MLRFDPPEDGVRRVSLTAVPTPGLDDSPMVFYHAIVHGDLDDGRRVQRREQFRHPVPALDWFHETVPGFDLLDTVAVNVPAEGSVDDSTSGTTER